MPLYNVKVMLETTMVVVADLKARQASAFRPGKDSASAGFATLSDGSFVEPLNSFRKHEARLRRWDVRILFS